MNTELEKLLKKLELIILSQNLLGVTEEYVLKGNVSTDSLWIDIRLLYLPKNKLEYY